MTVLVAVGWAIASAVATPARSAATGDDCSTTRAGSYASVATAADAITVFRPVYPVGRARASLEYWLARGQGYMATFGRGSGADVVLMAGFVCATGEWGGFDAPGVRLETVLVAGVAADMRTIPGKPGALVTWRLGGTSYLLGSYALPRARMRRVAAGLGQVAPAPSGTRGRWCVIDTTPLNVRSAPGVENGRLGAIPVGDCTVRDSTRGGRLALASTGRPWRLVRWRGLMGWVADSMLRAAR